MRENIATPAMKYEQFLTEPSCENEDIESVRPLRYPDYGEGSPRGDW